MTKIAQAGASKWLGCLALGAATFLAYLPVWRAGFVWDDDSYVTGNLALRSLKGLWQIWFVPAASPQYYPLSFASFWLDYHLWQLRPLGYHLANVLLHAVNSILLWTCLRRLAVPGAWLAAALFAVHPVNVESVAWVTERKNVLAGFFYLSSALAYLRFQPPETTAEAGPALPISGWGRWKWYGVALLLYLCALLAKTSAVALPVALLLVVWWKKRGKVCGQELWPLAPFLAAGLAMGCFTVWVEKHLVQAVGSEWNLSWPERCLVAGRAVWFYLGKLVWPHPLIFVYPRWEIDAAQPLAYVPVAGLVGALLVLWFNRRGWGRPVLVALLYYLALLFPVLGFFNVYFFRYSFVADHFQYLASIAPLTLAAALIESARRKAKGATQAICRLPPSILYLLPVLLGILTWRQCGMYADIETLWRTTLARNPECWMAHNNLGIALAARGQLAEAIQHYERALQLNPEDFAAHGNLGAALADQGKRAEAMREYQRALQINPHYAAAYDGSGNVLSAQGELAEAIQQYERALELNPDSAKAHCDLGVALAAKGQCAQAIQQYEQAIQLNPDLPVAYLDLGVALADQGQWSQAIQQYKQAVQLKPDLAVAHCDWGVALAAQGQWAEAIQHYERALELNPDYAEAHCQLGGALIQQGQWAAAIQHYERAVQLKPDYADAHVDWGTALAAQGKVEAAIQHFERALQLDPDSALAHADLGIELAKRGKLVEAGQHFERALQLNPHYAEAHYYLGIALAGRGQTAEATLQFQQALDLATTQGNSALAESIRTRLQSYPPALPPSPTP